MRDENNWRRAQPSMVGKSKVESQREKMNESVITYDAMSQETPNSRETSEASTKKRTNKLLSTSLMSKQK